MVAPQVDGHGHFCADARNAPQLAGERLGPDLIRP